MPLYYDSEHPFQLLLGTLNPGKLRELIALLGDLPVELLTPEKLATRLEIPESGNSYLQNALYKASTWTKHTNQATLADDSGLEVEHLGGAPGLFSHRYTGIPDASDADRRRFLTTSLSPFPHPWRARFFCAVAITFPNLDYIHATGQCTGEIIPEARGSNGFGYDPIFLVDGLGLTMAELTDEAKNRISHRAQAIISLKPLLMAKLAAPG